MKKDLKDKWVAALRSGKYKQGKHFLRSDEGFCCLGVLCDVYNSEVWEYSFNGFVYEEQRKSLDLLHRDKFGLFDQHVLIEKNDRGISFDEIADYIEKELV